MGIIYKDETYAIQGACFEVYKTLGSGFLLNLWTKWRIQPKVSQKCDNLQKVASLDEDEK